MKHHFLDYYWTIESPVHRIDPRLKIITVLIMLISIVITPNGRFIDYIFFFPIIIALIHVSKLPIMFVLKRTAMILPLVIIIAASMPFMSPGRPITTFKFIAELTITDTGLLNFTSVVFKATLAIWTMTLLTATTPFRDLLAGMQKLKSPVIFTSLLGFIYRYIFLFVDEAEHLSIGRRSRSFGKSVRLSIKGFAWMISSLLLRSFERGERVYHAMCARGYDGTYRTMTELRLTARDVLISSSLVALIFAVKLIGYHYGLNH